MEELGYGGLDKQALPGQWLKRHKVDDAPWDSGGVRTKREKHWYNNLKGDPVCIFCEGKHWGDAREVINTISTRRQFFREEKLCFNRSRAGHWEQQRRRQGCSKCKSRHHTSLCDKDKNRPTVDNRTALTSYSPSAHEWSLKATIPVKIKGETLWAYLDTGAGRNFIRSKAAKRLNLKAELHECYIFLFTWAISRAVQLELTKTQTTEEFQRKLNLATGTRPRVMVSDNTSVLKSTATWMKNSRKSERLQGYLARQDKLAIQLIQIPLVGHVWTFDQGRAGDPSQDTRPDIPYFWATRGCVYRRREEFEQPAFNLLWQRWRVGTSFNSKHFDVGAKWFCALNKRLREAKNRAWKWWRH